MKTSNQFNHGEKTVSRFRKSMSGRLSLLLVMAALAYNAFGQTLTTLHSFGGTLYELSPPGTKGDPWTETILHRFHGAPDGKTFLSRLSMTSTGSLIGTTVGGGRNHQGTAYMVSPPLKNGVWE